MLAVFCLIALKDMKLRF